MRRLLAVALLLVASPLAGQTAIGLRAGHTSANVSLAEVEESEPDPRRGMTAEISVTHLLTEQLGLRLSPCLFGMPRERRLAGE